MSDQDEFMERAKKKAADKSAAEKRKKANQQAFDAVPQDLDAPPAKQKNKKHIGASIQYSYLDDGYTPTSKTIQTLPSDCYTLHATQRGLLMRPQEIKTDDLMRLPDSQSDAVIREIEEFWKLKPVFTKYGFSHKRGFLLWGPPGSGKTSTVAVVIKETIKMGGVVFIADEPVLLMLLLKEFRSVEPDRPLVVIWEDIDTIIDRYGEAAVLSILDGEAQIDNVVFIATTNYPENLDGRVINRPSRFDKIVKINTPNTAAREMYLKAKIKTTKVNGIDVVKETEGMSIAHLKEFIVSVFCQKSCPQETLERLKKMARPPKSSDTHTPLGLR